LVGLPLENFAFYYLNYLAFAADATGHTHLPCRRGVSAPIFLVTHVQANPEADPAVDLGGSSPSYRWKSHRAPPKSSYKFEEEE